MTKTEELLQSCIYQIVRENPFIGGLLQELTFKFNNQIPTAAIGFDQKTLKYELMFNLTYFNGHKKPQRIAVLTHEILHFLHKHLFRWMQLDIKAENRSLWNIAADMAINQYIQGLPEGTIDVSKFKIKDGTPFPKFLTMEQYYELLQQNRDPSQKGQPQKGADGKDKKCGHQKSEDGKGHDPQECPDVMGTGNEGPNKEELDKYQPFDEHNWDDLSEEDKERMAREAEKIIRRTIEKTQYGHSQVPGFVQDFLKDLDTYLRKLNYKAILRAAIKKTVMSQDREHSWKRPNKRYGVYAPGTNLSRIPRINMYIDTSGSISHNELNEFLDVIDAFLKAGSKTCRLVLWHTQPYYDKKYRLKSRIKASELQSGGTDPNPTLEMIKKQNPDLSIILTDGFYDKTNVKVTSDLIWIISKQGNKDHPNKHMGKTIPLDGIK